MSHPGDLSAYVRAAAAAGQLVVQPRMGMANPVRMRDGLLAVRGADAHTVGTITLDSYTRVGDHDGARSALEDGGELNGFPIVAHDPRIVREVVSAVPDRPIQVRHGSAVPESIFAAMSVSGLSATEGGPVSYCLPYGRTPLRESVHRWREASSHLVESSAAAGRRAHIETFGGCLLGQLCPPSLLVAVSLLEGMFFAQRGVPTVSLSYAQQTNAVQDVEALAALRELAGRFLPGAVDWHIVLYTYMGLYPTTESGAMLLLDRSAELAVRGGAERLIVKTAMEAHRLPTVAENVRALERAARLAQQARRRSALPRYDEVDHSEVLAEATAMVEAVLELSEDIGTGLLNAFQQGLLDVPFCLHEDNRGLTQGWIDDGGRLVWVKQGRLPLPATARRAVAERVSSSGLLRMLAYTSTRFDQLAMEAEAAPAAVEWAK
ncbi:methylaspartate mutase [Saccharopolyspora spinosa]|uniref:Glutamate mutase subunit E n=1 Tax=Saccharopolyspora spinosa TaxID=60894 RepID=A0A2N3Y1E0_SACSN|nr:methylaspartate mutase [Saccharopolyspora spinosa]PKW16748.1 glutamate mutase subunit E [Saccharopolyspora spinosa]